MTPAQIKALQQRKLAGDRATAQHVAAILCTIANRFRSRREPRYTLRHFLGDQGAPQRPARRRQTPEETLAIVQLHQKKLEGRKI